MSAPEYDPNAINTQYAGEVPGYDYNKDAAAAGQPAPAPGAAGPDVRCDRCGGSGHLARECSSPPGDNTKGMECYKCRGRGHFARDCANIRNDLCYVCNQTGHHGPDCPTLPIYERGSRSRRGVMRGAFGAGMRGGRGFHPYGRPMDFRTAGYAPPYGAPGPIRGPAMRCYACQEYGHIARDCPTQQGMPGGMPPGMAPNADPYAAYGAHPQDPTASMWSVGEMAPPKCYNCGESGHIARDCPAGNPGGHSATCFKCGQPGHRAAMCTSAIDVRKCYACQEYGHTAANCPRGPR